MNIQNRLKKIEAAIIASNPEPANCICWEKHWRSAVDEAYNDDPNVEIKVYPAPDFEKGFCDKCQKPISAVDRQMRDNINECYGDGAT